MAPHGGREAVRRGKIRQDETPLERLVQVLLAPRARRSAEEPVRHHEAASRTQHATHLGEERVLVRGVARALEGPHHVEVRVGERRAREVLVHELDRVGEPRIRGRGTGDAHLRRADRDPYHPSAAVRREPEGAPADAAARVEDALARQDVDCVREDAIRVEQALLVGSGRATSHAEVERAGVAVPEHTVELHCLIEVASNSQGR